MRFRVSVDKGPTASASDELWPPLSAPLAGGSPACPGRPVLCSWFPALARGGESFRSATWKPLMNPLDGAGGVPLRSSGLLPYGLLLMFSGSYNCSAGVGG